MLNLPWDLWLNPLELPPGIGLETEYDVLTARLQITVVNRGSEPVAPGTVGLTAELESGATGNWAWLHGRYMQTDALVRNFGEAAPEGYDGRFLRESNGRRAYVSREVGTLSVLSLQPPVLLAGSLRGDRFFFDIEYLLNEDETRIEGLSLRFDLEATVVAPGGRIELPPVLFVAGSDARELIERYGDQVATEMSARVPDHVPTGWCSWYYFYNKVSETDVVANLADMVSEKHPAEYVQIDDGFQSHTGDWLTANEKFPSGMKSLADQIRASGYKPGLWLAPFVLNEESAALREHPDMVLKDASGETVFVPTWLGRCAVLDCTSPEAEAWLRNVVRTVVREWGYEYLKLDALSFAARPGTQVRYFAPGTTAPANVRRGLEIIRDEAGDSTFILGCTCHFAPAVGLVDAMRVGPDVKEIWANGPSPSVKHAIRLTLQRNWMHMRWWANDPDCLIVRDTDTSLDEAETRFLATGIAISGGMVVASDDLPKLSPERREMALALFPPPGVAARPLDPADGPVPRIWRAELGEGRSLIGVLNWDDKAEWIPWAEILKPGEVAFDVWNARMLPMGDVYLRPHEGTLWQVSAPGKTPRVVGDSASLTGRDLFVRQVSGRLQVRNDSPRDRVIAIQHRGQAWEVDLSPGEMRWFD
ncbi:MAG: glycoside hydrolase family 36 protein [Dehalococcoidia bacterium]